MNDAGLTHGGARLANTTVFAKLVAPHRVDVDGEDPATLMDEAEHPVTLAIPSRS